MIRLFCLTSSAANSARARVQVGGLRPRLPVAHGQRPISEGWLRDMFARLLKRMGLPGHYTPYSLRYSYNMLLYVGGVAGKPRSVLMGHVRETFNVQTYVKALPQMFEGVTETLERQIFGDARASFAPREDERVM